MVSTLIPLFLHSRHCFYTPLSVHCNHWNYTVTIVFSLRPLFPQYHHCWHTATTVSTLQPLFPHYNHRFCTVSTAIALTMVFTFYIATTVITLPSLPSHCMHCCHTTTITLSHCCKVLLSCKILIKFFSGFINFRYRVEISCFLYFDTK